MFSNLILRNSRCSRKENGLFFSALVISIVAFYIILSIANQDVMIFLAEMESYAVDKLLRLIPVFFTMTLGILFFLIYFACKYQLQRRRHEFGVYLMMGMRRSKLFAMLLAEDLVSSALALLAGIPIAVLLSEGISLVSAKLVGMGIIGHRFSLSLSAVAFTVAGFLAIKLAAFLILSGKISRQQIGTLLEDVPGGTKKQLPRPIYLLAALDGIAMLAAAYIMAIRGYAWQKASWMLLTLLLGLVGTLLLFYGMRALIALLAKAGAGRLRVFNFRQIEENVVQQSATIAISSLLILAALCCFGAGLGISLYSASNQQFGAHVLDYTFAIGSNIRLDEKPSPAGIFPRLQAVLQENGLEKQFAVLFPLREGLIRTSDSSEGVFVMDTVLEGLRQLPQSQDRDILLNNLGYADFPNVICLSDYNRLLALAGKPGLTLGEQEAAVYMMPDFEGDPKIRMMDEILSDRPATVLDGAPLTLTGQVQTTNLVTDNAITLSFALILPDERFFYYTQAQYEVYVNGVLRQDVVAQKGLMRAIMELNGRLDAIGLEKMDIEYENYLQNTARQLVYIVGASYISIYLAIIFLIVANTILGVQFLMSQHKTGRRYQILVRLGADYKLLCSAARKQIGWFIGLPVLVAAVSSLFGVRSLFAGFLSEEMQGAQGMMLKIAAAVILLLLVVEWIYMTAVKRSSDRYLLTLMEPQREE